MKLFYYCSSCQKENAFKTKATNRFELQTERGNFINERCKHCGTIVKRGVNRVHAKSNKWLILGGLVVSICATILLGGLGWIASATFAIPFLAWRMADKNASTFNRVMVDDK